MRQHLSFSTTFLEHEIVPVEVLIEDLPSGLITFGGCVRQVGSKLAQTCYAAKRPTFFWLASLAASGNPHHIHCI